MATFTLGELAFLSGSELVGEADFSVLGVRPLETAGPSDISFLTHSKYRPQALESRAGALIVGPAERGGELNPRLLVAVDPYRVLAAVLQAFFPRKEARPGVHRSAVVGEGASVHATASIGPFVSIGENALIEAGVVVGSHVSVGTNCRVGRDSVLHPHCVLYENTEIGQRVIVHSGAVLGADGFGFAGGEAGPVKLPQVGRVVVEDDVEIGANSTIDRATFERTRIGRGAKLDNLVQVGHNVDLGEGSLLCAQSGISGSTKVGKGVIFAGQSGAANHLTIGDGVRIAAQAAVLRSVGDGQAVGGSPAVPLQQWRREVASRARLSDALRRLRVLEKRVDAERGPAKPATGIDGGE